MCFYLLNDDEKWTAIEGYVGLYAISNMGRVYSHITNKFLKGCPNKDGYLQVGLCKDSNIKTVTIHILVGNAFVGKRTNELPEFDHKDRNRLNNCASNIRLATRAEQIINQNLRCTNKTGEKNIIIDENRYRIQIRRNKIMVFNKSYPMEKYTLEDCVIIRDEFLQTLT